MNLNQNYFFSSFFLMSNFKFSVTCYEYIIFIKTASNKGESFDRIIM